MAREDLEYIEEVLAASVGSLLPELLQAGATLEIEIAEDGNVSGTRFLNCLLAF